MRVERWPGGDFELEPGDMVRIRPDTRVQADCVYGTLLAVEDGVGRVVKIPSDSPPAMFLGEDTEPLVSRAWRTRVAQVLYDGKIVNISTLYVEPVK